MTAVLNLVVDGVRIAYPIIAFRAVGETKLRLVLGVDDKCDGGIFHLVKFASWRYN